ncbi:hypothetical protein [Hartmannibacter diazotrophicus]|nr:hypothetical protein [Hartmannibacter diazotrophicus]
MTDAKSEHADQGGDEKGTKQHAEQTATQAKPEPAKGSKCN